MSTKQKVIDQTIRDIRSRYGDGAILKMDGDGIKDIEVIPTGNIAIDRALGVGGIPKGRITEVYGPEGSGKTSLTLHVIAECQKSGGVAAFVDMEHALDPNYADSIGVNVEDLYISQPDSGEEALEITEALVRSGAIDLVVVDSVAALVPRAEIEGEMGDSHPGLQARLMSQALRKIAGSVKKTDTALVFTNQLRMKIGVMFGSPETTSGGRALRFYATVRIDIRAFKRGSWKDDKGELLGQGARIRVKKNKVAPPHKQAEVWLRYGEGFDPYRTMLELAQDEDIISKRGSYYYDSEGELIAQGFDNAAEQIRSNPAYYERLRTAVLDPTEENIALAVPRASDQSDAQDTHDEEE